MSSFLRATGVPVLCLSILAAQALGGCSDSDAGGAGVTSGGSGGAGSGASGGAGGGGTSSGGTGGGGTGGGTLADLPDTLSLNGAFFPESLAAGNGKLFASSFTTGEIQVFDLNAPGRAETFVPAATGALPSGWGLYVDEARQWLLACANAPFGAMSPPPVEVRAYALDTGALAKTWVLPAGAIGNSVVVDNNGNIYVSDVGPSPRIIKIDTASDAVTVWKEDPGWVAVNGFGLGGLTFDGETTLYGSGASDELWRVAIQPDGSAGPVEFIPVTDEEGNVVSFQVDGFQAIDKNTFIGAANDAFAPGPQGSLVEVTLDGDDPVGATLHPIATELADPSGVTAYRLGDKQYAFVSESQLGFLFQVDTGQPKMPFTIRVYGLSPADPI